MATHSNAQVLGTRLSVYLTDAEKLESERSNLVKKILDLAKTEIIPALSNAFPANYDILVERTKVVGVNSRGEPAHGEVPVAFGVQMVLGYEGKPVKMNNMPPHMDRVTRLNQEVCRELADRYCLNRIVISVGSTQIG